MMERTGRMADEDEKTAVTVNSNTWEALCEASDEYGPDATVTDLQEIRYLAERLIEESRGYQAAAEGDAGTAKIQI